MTFNPANERESVSFESIETDQSVTVTEGEATDTLHYGSDQDRPNAGDESVAIGFGARAPEQNNTAIGFEAAQNNTAGDVMAAGYKAAQNNTGNDVTAVGNVAGENNTAGNVVAAGFGAARNNTGGDVMAAGYKAARNNTGDKVTAVGNVAARFNTGADVTATGFAAALKNTGNNVTVAGFSAARGNGLADPSTMGDDNIGIGDSAIRNNQASGLIAIGQEAGINAQTDDQFIITDRNGNRRMEMDLTNGDLSIEGSLTQNASL